MEAVYAVALDAPSARCREGDGPFLIEAETYRWHGHYEGDAQPYKPEDEAAGWRERDPLRVAGANSSSAGLETEARLEEMRDEAQAGVEAASSAPGAADPPRSRRRTSMSIATEPVRATSTPSAPAWPTRWRTTSASS